VTSDHLANVFVCVGHFIGLSVALVTSEHLGLLGDGYCLRTRASPSNHNCSTPTIYTRAK